MIKEFADGVAKQLPSLLTDITVKVRYKAGQGYWVIVVDDQLKQEYGYLDVVNAHYIYQQILASRLQAKGLMKMPSDFQPYVDDDGIYRFEMDKKGKYRLTVMQQLKSAHSLTLRAQGDEPEAKAWKAMVTAIGRIEEDIRVLLENALQIDGAHHKQWYIEQVMLRLGLDLDVEHDAGIAP